MKLETMNGNKRVAQTTLKSALEAFLDEVKDNGNALESVEINGDFISGTISLAKGVDADGAQWFAVGGYNVFTNMFDAHSMDFEAVLIGLENCYWDDAWTEKESN